MELQIKTWRGTDKQTDHLASKTILNTPATYLSLPLTADLNPPVFILSQISQAQLCNPHGQSFCS